jgi:hypothetical protein
MTFDEAFAEVAPAGGGGGGAFPPTVVGAQAGERRRELRARQRSQGVERGSGTAAERALDLREEDLLMRLLEIEFRGKKYLRLNQLVEEVRIRVEEELGLRSGGRRWSRESERERS